MAGTEPNNSIRADLVEIEVVDPAHPHAQHCLAEYFAELDRRFEGGFDPSHSRPTPLDEMRPPAGVFLLATLHGDPVGCGGLRFHGAAPVEIKRMWVASSARGLGVGRRLLATLEAHAAAEGHHVVQLDTNSALLQAISMYRAAGYREVEAFNDEPYAHHWFEKDLRAPAAPPEGRGRPRAADSGSADAQA